MPGGWGDPDHLVGLLFRVLWQRTRHPQCLVAPGAGNDPTKGRGSSRRLGRNTQPAAASPSPKSPIVSESQGLYPGLLPQCVTEKPAWGPRRGPSAPALASAPHSSAIPRARAIKYRQENQEAVGGFFSQIGELYVVHHLWGRLGTPQEPSVAPSFLHCHSVSTLRIH